MDKKIINKIKQATVSFVLLKDQEKGQQQECPFMIIGSGFCIHKQGAKSSNLTNGCTP